MKNEDSRPHDLESIICFVDLKNSTRLLREVRDAYKKFQEHMLTAIESQFESLNVGKDLHLKFHQFTGDGFIFISNINSAASNPIAIDLEKDRYKSMLLFIEALGNCAINFTLNEEGKSLKDRLGMRFGIATGRIEQLTITRSSPVNSASNKTPDANYYIGEALNLAARLEHATRLEFLDFIRQKTSAIGQYTSLLSSPDKISGTSFEDELVALDRQIGYIKQATEARFEIRATRDFKDGLPKDLVLGWKTVYLEPKGFPEQEEVNLLYGENPGEMFTPV